MKSRILAAGSALITTLIATGPALPCTAFMLANGDQRVVAKSYDWDIGHGLVVFNKRGLAKQNLPAKLREQQAQWVSKYASLTFNQYGRELPVSGVNEAGLVVETLWLSSTRYPPFDERPTLNELQWVQYQLDNHASVVEMIEHAPEVRISTLYGKVHFLACDRTGTCATFDYIDGKLEIHQGKSLPVRTLTNHAYTESVGYLKKHEGFGGRRAVASGTGSLDRFVRASANARKQAADPVQQAFSILDDVSMGDFSKWNLVYDLTNMRIHFRSSGHEKKKSIDFKAFDTSCRTPTKMLELNNDFAGDVTAKFIDYTDATNLALVQASFKDIEDKLPPGAVLIVANLPRAFRCTLEPDQNPGP